MKKQKPVSQRQKPGILKSMLYECHFVGNYVKVCAIDPVTGTEVVVVGDRQASMTMLEHLAANKLQYVLNKKYGEREQIEKGGDGRTSGRGLIV